MRPAGRHRGAVENFDRKAPALQGRERIGRVRIAGGSQPENAAGMPQRERRFNSRVELAPELARAPGEARVDLRAPITEPQDPGFVARTRTRVARPIRIDERDDGDGFGQWPGGPRAEDAGPYDNDIGHFTREAYCVSALAIAARNVGSSGVTLLGKNATTLPSLPTTYLEKFQAGRLPVVPR